MDYSIQLFMTQGSMNIQKFQESQVSLSFNFRVYSEVKVGQDGVKLAYEQAKGAFIIYVNKQRWVGGQSNVDD